MAPYPQPDAQLSVDEITNEDLHCGRGAPYGCAMMLILFMLIFYALALWDRYLKLKTKESNRLYSKADLIQAYHSINSSGQSTPRSSCRSPTFPPRAPTPPSPKIIVTPAPESSSDAPVQRP
ncbi:uncharacterized protein SCHCODRAFT_01038111 [Schizophyllum commune H4-8]|uniref:uncharacterized protein n=1 Tax=Schizophyllum commune (strain H4-8 / FGSC 9210) TaxID=578458 RepID=UPI0021607FFC|nr:uncharacterized protein SCHCODRAFT_01038111 [Schizophyllum commune H4-8]KAI5896240.1 hypothetical protein SCHCODRAFT_01038111 [Schizophyllum commune H4-8]